MMVFENLLVKPGTLSQEQKKHGENMLRTWENFPSYIYILKAKIAKR